MKTAFLLIFALITALVSAGNLPAGGVAVDPEPRIAYSYGPNMRFGVSVVKDQAGKPIAKLLTFAANGRTNSTVLRIDGKEYEFGGLAGKWVEKQAKIAPDAGRKSRDATRSTWELGGVRVQQIVEIVAGKQPVEIAPGVSKRLYDTCLIRYVIENAGSKPHQVGLRFQLDTLIGANDGVPFMVPGLPGLVKTMRDFPTAKEVPDFVQALEKPDLQNPGTIAHLTLKVGGMIEAPDRVSLTRWPNNNPLTWNIAIADMEDDSAVVQYWNERELKPGGQRTVGVAYGLGTVSSGSTGKIALTVSGAFEVGQDFSATAYVKNPVKGETLNLILPEGLQRIQGKDKEIVPALATGDGVVTWKVKALRAGEFPVTVRSSRGLEASKTVTISPSAVPVVPEAHGKVIFLLVQNSGEKFGPADDALETEVVFRLDSHPDRLFGFTLRDDPNSRPHQAMLDILRAAFVSSGTVHINYEIANGKTNAHVTRLWVERKAILTKPIDGK